MNLVGTDLLILGTLGIIGTESEQRKRGPATSSHPTRKKHSMKLTQNAPENSQGPKKGKLHLPT